MVLNNTNMKQFYIIGSLGFSIYCVLEFSGQPSYMNIMAFRGMSLRALLLLNQYI